MYGRKQQVDVSYYDTQVKALGLKPGDWVRVKHARVIYPASNDRSLQLVKVCLEERSSINIMPEYCFDVQRVAAGFMGRILENSQRK